MISGFWTKPGRDRLKPSGVARYVVRSGNANNTTNTGPFYANANNSVANTNTNIGGHGSMMA